MRYIIMAGGTPLRKGPRGYTVINDYTCDIDTPEDTRRFGDD
jgi:hypothetical protein